MAAFFLDERPQYRGEEKLRKDFLYKVCKFVPMNKTTVVLGSGSPRRRELMEQAEIPFQVLVSDVAEDFDPEMPAPEVPVCLAERKAKAIKEQFAPDSEWIITADTVVVLHHDIINKPTDEEDAVAILKRLSGQKHTVITGVCIMKGAEMLSFSDATDVFFNELSEEEIRYFVNKYRPLDKAGAYAIQEWIGLIGVRRIEGCFYNVMGLPVPKMYGILKNMGYQ
jgi:septum formation protein